MSRSTAIAYRPPVGVLRGYAATKSAATTALGALLLPSGKPLTIADFGRTQFAAVLAATATFAAATTRMPPKPRYNFQFLLNDLTSSLEVKDEDVPTFRLSPAYAASAVANRALYFAATLRDLPDVYFDNLAIFANDHDKITARGALEVFQRSAGIASRGGKSALATAHAEAFRCTSTNAAGHITERLHARWLQAPNALRETSDTSLAPSTAPPALASAEDDDDEADLKAGACVVETQFAPRAWAGTAATPWDPSPQGTFDNLLVALAVTGLPSAVLWIAPTSDHPIERVVEYRDAVYPWPSPSEGNPTVPAQTTKPPTRDFAPSLFDDAGAAITDATWLTSYAESHSEWNIIMVRKGSDDGLLSFAALVNSEMGTPPTSLADETAAATAFP